MRITIDHVKNQLGIEETYDIVNAIRNESPNMQNYVPLAHAENVTEIGHGIMINQTVQNEFITSLVDRISLVVVRAVSLSNPLAKFKKGNMPQGRTIEEIFTDITSSKKYDAHDAEETFMRREIPNVKTLFHERNRQDFYKQTIQDDSLKSAFTSWGNFGNFVSSIINAIYNSAEVEEYEYMKLLADNYYAKGLFKVEQIDPVDTETSAREFVKKVRATATKMSLPNGSRDYNSLAVRTRTAMSDMHLVINADISAEVDVEVLARAFNMDKSDFMGNVTIIDGFQSEGLEAILIDKEWFMVYDNLRKMETIRNPQGLYWNYYYHIWQTLSVSRFANAVAFVSGEVKPVSQVIVDPSIVSVRQGRSFKFTPYVRTNDGVDREVVWDVVGSTDASSVGVGTKIEDGKLTIGDNQVGELKVTATVSYTEGEDEVEVVGESLVTIVPNESD